MALATAGAVAFSGKAIIVKLAYRHGVDAVHADHVPHALRCRCSWLLAWWAGRGKPPLTRRDLDGRGRAGVLRVLPCQLARLHAGLMYVSASLERLILYLNPTMVLLLSALLFKRCIGLRELGAMAVSYAGVLLVFGHELKLAGRHGALGSALVFGSVLQLRRLPGLQRRDGAAPRGAAPDRRGHQRGLPVRIVQFRAAAASAALVAPRGDLAVSAQRRCAPSPRC
jgi:hypothetical protein